MINIIPRPYKVSITKGKYTIDNTTSVSVEEQFAIAADFLNQYIKETVGFDLNRGESANKIVFLRENTLKPDAYILDIREDGITVSAENLNGALYAVQSIRQLFGLYAGAGNNLTVATCRIEDVPRYEWRGLMLDEARHFFGMDEVKRILDLMMLHKLNIFHWHLTDDQGWRIEIKKYPLLTEIGSKRNCSNIHGWNKIDVDNIPVSGYYTQEQIKEVVAYAKERGITVVPEIDMPGHFMAAIAAYPYLSCRDAKVDVAYYFGGTIPKALGIKDWDLIACAGKESTYQFLSDVIDEMCEIFPSKYFHIGGDEVPKAEWKVCPHCQLKMTENNLTNEEDLQGYFNNRIYDMLTAKDKKMVGWNEILRAKNINNDVIGQYWLPGRDKATEEFLNNGGKIIMSKHESFYFDMSYAQIPLKTTYNFKSIFQSIKSESSHNIIGVEAPLWTEWVADREKLDCSLFPRMTALSEVCWTMEENKNMEDFLVRLNGFKRLLDACNVQYAEDEVAMPKGRIRRGREIKMWYYSNQHYDVEKNRKAKEKLKK